MGKVLEMLVGNTNSASRKNNDDFQRRKTKSSVAIFIFATTELLLTKNSVHAGWVDPDTHLQYRSIKPLTPGDNREYKLVSISTFECFFSRLV
jgi:hypothetical protein